MADIKLVIKINEEDYETIKHNIATGIPLCPLSEKEVVTKIANGTPLTSNMLADMLMEERIRGELKHDVAYSKDIIDDVKCKLTVDIIDRRPYYCGAELREVWRESENVRN